jgi:hypoxanthine phosphoribosyltransferase
MAVLAHEREPALRVERGDRDGARVRHDLDLDLQSRGSRSRSRTTSKMRPACTTRVESSSTRGGAAVPPRAPTSLGCAEARTRRRGSSGCRSIWRASPAAKASTMLPMSATRVLVGHDRETLQHFLRALEFLHDGLVLALLALELSRNCATLLEILDAFVLAATLVAALGHRGACDFSRPGSSLGARRAAHSRALRGTQNLFDAPRASNASARLFGRFLLGCALAGRVAARGPVHDPAQRRRASPLQRGADPGGNRPRGREVTRTYAARDFTVVAVLKGSCVFASDLIRRIPVPLELAFLAASSYGDGTKSGRLRDPLLPPGNEIEGRNLLLVDDILDTGARCRRAPSCCARRARSAHLRLPRQAGAARGRLQPDFRCFEVEDLFVVGYGLDFAGRYRNLPYVGALRQRAASAVRPRARSSRCPPTSPSRPSARLELDEFLCLTSRCSTRASCAARCARRGARRRHEASPSQRLREHQVLVIDFEEDEAARRAGRADVRIPCSTRTST